MDLSGQPLWTGPSRCGSALASFMLLTACSCGSQPGEGDRTQNAHGVTDAVVVALSTDRSRYAPGDSLLLTLTVANRSTAAVTLPFSSGQRYDFTISTGTTILWRWSDDQLFIQMLGEERLAPGAELVYRERAAAPAAPGTYRVTGMLTVQDQVRQARVTISVVP